MSEATADTPLAWRKASSSANNGQCVEIADLPGGMAVRDSKDPDGPRLRFSAEAWEQFATAMEIGPGAFEDVPPEVVA